MLVVTGDFTLIIHLFNKQLNRTYYLLLCLCDKKIAKKNYNPLLFWGKYWVDRSGFLEEKSSLTVTSRVFGFGILLIQENVGLIVCVCETHEKHTCA